MEVEKKRDVKNKDILLLEIHRVLYVNKYKKYKFRIFNFLIPIVVR